MPDEESRLRQIISLGAIPATHKDQIILAGMLGTYIDSLPDHMKSLIFESLFLERGAAPNRDVLGKVIAQVVFPGGDTGETHVERRRAAAQEFTSGLQRSATEAIDKDVSAGEG